MKKLLFAVIVISIFSIGFSTVSVNFPRRSHSGNLNQFTIYGKSNVKFDVVVFLPPEMKLIKWNVNASQANYWFESKEYKYKGRLWNAYHWYFYKGNYKLTFYSITPNETKDLDILVIWTDENGNFKEIDKKFLAYTGNIPPPICGNGICEPGENFFTCPSDCGGVVSYITIALLIIGLVVGAGSLFGFYMRKKEAEEAIESEYNIDKLVAYVKSALKAGIPEHEIKYSLYKMGWDPKVVNYIIQKVRREL